MASLLFWIVGWYVLTAIILKASGSAYQLVVSPLVLLQAVAKAAQKHRVAACGACGVIVIWGLLNWLTPYGDTLSILVMQLGLFCLIRSRLDKECLNILGLGLLILGFFLDLALMVLSVANVLPRGVCVISLLILGALLWLLLRRRITPRRGLGNLILNPTARLKSPAINAVPTNRGLLLN